MTDQFVHFRNKGLLDIRCITTFGVSVKEGPNPIGQFGTGLKYAIAVLLREGMKVELYIGKQHVVFNTLPETIRGKEFQMIYMTSDDGCLPLGFTTELGKKWELWMAFRELYSNCIDEAGTVYSTTEEVGESYEDETLFVVEGEAFAQVLTDKADIFLETQPGSQLVDTYGGRLNVHEGESKAVYNNGIRIAEFEKPLMHRYDIPGSIDLTEDRTLKYGWEFDSKLTRAVANSDDDVLIEKIITAPKEVHEAGLNFGNATFGTTFLDTVKRLYATAKNKINPTVVRAYEELCEKLAGPKRESYTVRLVRPEDTSPEEMVEYINAAINCYRDAHPGIDPLHNLHLEVTDNEVRF